MLVRPQKVLRDVACRPAHWTCLRHAACWADMPRMCGHKSILHRQCSHASAGSASARSLQGLLDLSGCWLSLGAWSGPTGGLFTLPATMGCPLLGSLSEELGIAVEPLSGDLT